MADFNETFDWVVVGSGAGSMSSGLLMREAGKSVLILEKSPYVGGTSARSGGVMWIPDNPFMDPGEDSPEKAMTYLNAVVEDSPDTPGTSPEKRQAFVTEGRRMVEFLVKKNVALERCSRFWPDYYDELPGGCKTSRTVTAAPFDKAELGEWAPKLREGFLSVPVRLDEGYQLPFARNSWKIKLLIAQIGMRIAAGKLTGKQWVTAGAALQGRMLQRALEAGIEIRLETGVSQLIVEDGKVVGVVTEKDGQPWRVGSRLGVLVNAGGFSKNQAMRDKYMPGTNAEWSMTNECDMGDMHVEMERLGAVLAQMDEMVGFQITLPPGWKEMFIPPNGQFVTARPHAILVDRTGVRFMNEGGSYEAYCETMLKRNKVAPAVPSWAIMDSQFIDKYTIGAAGNGKVPRSYIDSGYLKRADTIEGLAAQIGVDPATIKATVDRFNGFVAKGRDEDFRRGDREYDKYLGDPFRKGTLAALGSIDKGPFYAAEIVPGDVSTYGGVITDVNSRVLRADGSAIEGLYATGVSTASPMGRVYPGAGASVGPSMTFGWIAAKHAAGLSNQAV